MKTAALKIRLRSVGMPWMTQNEHMCHICITAVEEQSEGKHNFRGQLTHYIARQ